MLFGEGIARQTKIVDLVEIRFVLLTHFKDCIVSLTALKQLFSLEIVPDELRKHKLVAALNVTICELFDGIGGGRKGGSLTQWKIVGSAVEDVSNDPWGKNKLDAWDARFSGCNRKTILVEDLGDLVFDRLWDASYEIAHAFLKLEKSQFVVCEAIDEFENIRFDVLGLETTEDGKEGIDLGCNDFVDLVCALDLVAVSSTGNPDHRVLPFAPRRDHRDRDAQSCHQQQERILQTFRRRLFRIRDLREASHLHDLNLCKLLAGVDVRTVADEMTHELSGRRAAQIRWIVFPLKGACLSID